MRNVPVPPANTVAPLLPTARLFSDDGGGLQDSLEIVVRDDLSWQRMWRLATSSQAVPADRPPIDFARQMVVIVAAGRMHPGDRIRVDSAGTRNNRFVVIVQRIISCPEIDAPSYPLEVVRVTRSDLPAEFNWMAPTPGPNCDGL